jgi:hypothetical protein
MLASTSCGCAYARDPVADAPGHGPIAIEVLRRAFLMQPDAVIRHWVHVAEEALLKAGLLKRQEQTALSLALRAAMPGERVRLPLAYLRPGQAELAFDVVRQNVGKCILRLANKSRTSLFDMKRAGVVVLEGGESVRLTDNHHKLTAAYAYAGYQLEVMGQTGLTGPRKQFVKDLASVRLPLWVRTNLNQEPAPSPQSPSVHHLGTAVDRFAQLENNPFRALAARHRGKLRTTGTLALDALAPIAWIKPTDAVWVEVERGRPRVKLPRLDYIEFFVAQALAQAGIRPDHDTAEAHQQALFAQRAHIPELRQVPLIRPGHANTPDAVLRSIERRPDGTLRFDPGAILFHPATSE